jgi:hypothetical protein
MVTPSGVMLIVTGRPTGRLPDAIEPLGQRHDHRRHADPPLDNPPQSDTVHLFLNPPPRPTFPITRSHGDQRPERPPRDPPPHGAPGGGRGRPSPAATEVAAMVRYRVLEGQACTVLAAIQLKRNRMDEAFGVVGRTTPRDRASPRRGRHVDRSRSVGDPGRSARSGARPPGERRRRRFGGASTPWTRGGESTTARLSVPMAHVPT